jgi:hypothetical protein
MMPRLALDFAYPHISVHVSADILIPSSEICEHLNLRLQVLINPLHDLLTSLETLLVEHVVLNFPPVRTLYTSIRYLDAAATDLFHTKLVKLVWVLNAVSPDSFCFF